MRDATADRLEAGTTARDATRADVPDRLFTAYLVAALIMLVVPFLLSYAIWVVTGEWAVRTAYQDVAPIAHASHALVGVLLLAAFPLQAMLGLRAAGARAPAQAVRIWHRRHGRLLVPVYLLYVATGMVMLWDSSVLARGVASLASVLQITVLVGASTAYFVLARHAARRGDIATHMDHILFALIAVANISLGRLVIASFKVLGIEPGAVTLPGGAVGFVSAGEFGAMTTMALLAVFWLSYAAKRGIVVSQWPKTAAFLALPLFWPITLVPGLGQ